MYVDRFAKSFIFLQMILVVLVTTSIAQNSRSITGTIIAPAGAPIANVNLVLTSYDPNQNWQLRTTSSQDGKFSFIGLKASRYIVKAKDAGLNFEAEKIVDLLNAFESNLIFKYGEACSETSSMGTSEILEKDYPSIFASAIQDATLSLLPHGDVPVLSRENLKSQWLFDINRDKVTLLSQNEIQRRADLSGDFNYYFFTNIRIENKNCVTITIENRWAVGTRSEKIYVSGNGITLEYRKINGKLEKKIVLQWVS